MEIRVGQSVPSVVTVSRRGAERVRAGHVWIYRSDIVQAEGVLPGALVRVQEAGVGARPTRARVLGSALYSTASEIAIRMISNRPVDDLDRLVRERVRAAVAYRERFVENTDAYRVIFSEADCLPGLIVDRYNDILSLQIVTQAMDSEPMRLVVMSELQEELKPAAISAFQHS